MDYQSVLDEVETWPVEQRIRLVDEIRNRISEDAPEIDDIELSDAWKSELIRRADEMDRDPDAGIPWEVVRAEAMKRLGKL